MSFPIEQVRRHFPSITGNPDYVFAENAGGSQVLGACADTVRDYLLRTNVQMANYYLAASAADRVAQGLSAVAFFAGADSTDEVMIGSSATQLAETLSRMIETTVLRQRKGEYKGQEPTWEEGDEIIISETDHETNRGAWLRLAERQGLIVKQWDVTAIAQVKSNAHAVELSLSSLEKLLSPRTRLVAFTACSNVLGGFTPIQQAAALVKAKTEGKAWVAVDAVAFAPHRALQPKEWGVDFVLWSFYKVFGPHTGALYLSPKASFQLLSKLNHHFLHAGSGTYPYQPSSQQYELIASIAPIVDYLVWIGQANQPAAAPRSIRWKELFEDKNHSAAGYAAKTTMTKSDKAATNASSDAASTTESKESLRKALHESFALIAAHEEQLSRTVIDCLTSEAMRSAGVRIVGPESWSGAARAPTVAFVVEGKSSAKIHTEMVRAGKMGAQQGHMYAYALIAKLGLEIAEGVVRISLVHYNTVEEAKQVCQVIEQAIKAV